MLNEIRSFRKSVKGKTFERIVPAQYREEVAKKIREKKFEEIVSSSSKIFRNIFDSVINYLLPKEFKGCFLETYTNSQHQGIYYRLVLPSKDQIDTIDETSKFIQRKNPHQLDKDRLFEIEFTNKLAKRSKADLLLVCFDKFVVVDQFGNHMDDWDGVLIEILDDRVNVIIVEAKNNTKRAIRANKAFKQLEGTKKILNLLPGMRTNRKRHKGFGATLTISF